MTKKYCNIEIRSGSISINSGGMVSGTLFFSLYISLKKSKKYCPCVIVVISVLCGCVCVCKTIIGFNLDYWSFIKSAGNLQVVLYTIPTVAMIPQMKSYNTK